MTISTRLSCLAMLWLMGSGLVWGAEFTNQVSTHYVDPNVRLNATTSVMETDWFTQQIGGRTVYSHDAHIGIMVHGAGDKAIYAHATWVIRYSPDTNTVNLNAGKTHITNWYFDQRCQVYEDGTCNCHNNPNWNICHYAPMAVYVRSLVAAARAAAINATIALQHEGVNVTRNP